METLTTKPRGIKSISKTALISVKMIKGKIFSFRVCEIVIKSKCHKSFPAFSVRQKRQKNVFIK